MDLLHKQQVGTALTVIAVLAFNVIMLMLLELPLVGYATRPQWTAAAVQRFGDWLTRRRGAGRRDWRRSDGSSADRARDHQLVSRPNDRVRSVRGELAGKPSGPPNPFAESETNAAPVTKTSRY
jgi:hypothetical protein